MDENRVLILPADLVDRIDANRGEMSHAEFVGFLLQRLLRQDEAKDATTSYVTRQDLEGFERDMRALLRSFLDFFLSYGLELGPSPIKDDLHAQARKLQDVVGLAE